MSVGGKRVECSGRLPVGGCGGLLRRGFSALCGGSLGGGSFGRACLLRGRLGRCQGCVSLGRMKG
ncbi:hypothetical protein K523DRAFT_96557 [Schizophyllum commune Tattone D]|nr:hypothetical protein K523DRAFT_96557 [Schizophyllum commune Tattone D]